MFTDTIKTLKTLKTVDLGLSRLICGNVLPRHGVLFVCSICIIFKILLFFFYTWNSMMNDRLLLVAEMKVGKWKWKKKTLRELKTSQTLFSSNTREQFQTFGTTSFHTLTIHCARSWNFYPATGRGLGSNKGDKAIGRDQLRATLYGPTTVELCLLWRRAWGPLYNTCSCVCMVERVIVTGSWAVHWRL